MATITFNASYHDNEPFTVDAEAICTIDPMPQEEQGLGLVFLDCCRVKLRNPITYTIGDDQVTRDYVDVVGSSDRIRDQVGQVRLTP